VRNASPTAVRPEGSGVASYMVTGTCPFASNNENVTVPPGLNPELALPLGQADTLAAILAVKT
jgi:hypothetical protein